MRKTPWSSSSSVPSDRLAPRPKAPPPPSKSKSSKSPGSAIDNLPKSPEVRRLQSLLSSLITASLVDPDPKGGCFCRARTHPLSSSTPLCKSCGLILCTLNPPYTACPHCFAPLLSPQSRTTMIAELTDQIALTLKQEEEERERRVEEARLAAGAFPTLRSGGGGSGVGGSGGGGGGGGLSTPPGASTPPSSTPSSSHKVLSLTGGASGSKSKGKGKNATTSKPRAGVILETHTVRPASSSSPLSTAAASRLNAQLGSGGRDSIDNDADNMAKTRIAPPPPDPFHATHNPPPYRPFQNLLGGGGTYSAPAPPPPPPHSAANTTEDGGAGAGDVGSGGGAAKKRRPRGGKGKANRDATAGAGAGVGAHAQLAGAGPSAS